MRISFLQDEPFLRGCRLPFLCFSVVVDPNEDQLKTVTVLNPDSQWMRLFLSVRIFSALFIVVYAPLLCAFPREEDGMNVPSLRAAEVVCDVVHLCVMIISARTIIEQKVDGLSIMVDDPKQILKNYLESTMFRVHVLSLGIPFYLDEAFASVFGLSRIFFLIRMLKTLRIVDIHEVLRERISIKKHVILMKNLEVFRVLYWLLYLAHIMGCLFYIISCDEFGVPLRDSFITENNLIDRDVFERYWVTVYQVVVTVTTVGYGDIEIAFVNGAEMSFLCLLMIVSSVLYVNLFSFFAIDLHNTIHHTITDTHSCLL